MNPIAKRKREYDKEQQRKIDEGIGKYFSANPANAPAKPKVHTLFFRPAMRTS